MEQDAQAFWETVGTVVSVVIAVVIWGALIAWTLGPTGDQIKDFIKRVFKAAGEDLPEKIGRVMAEIIINAFRFAVTALGGYIVWRLFGQ
jgi:hypothetical protein